MQIEVDIGNTRSKWRWLASENDGYVYRSCNNSELLESLNNDLSNSVTHVLVSCVGSRLLEQSLVELIRSKDAAIEVFVARSLSSIGPISYAYKVIENLGVDRALAMLAAYALKPSGVLVIDAGSAMTIDFVQEDGIHLGGYILPGYDMLLDGLSHGTERVLFKKQAGQDTEPGKSTADCVNNGIKMMLSSSIKDAVHWAEQHGIKEVVFTGGNGGEMQALYNGVACYVEHLVFDGLVLAKSYQSVEKIEEGTHE